MAVWIISFVNSTLPYVVRILLLRMWYVWGRSHRSVIAVTSSSSMRDHAKKQKTFQQKKQNFLLSISLFYRFFFKCKASIEKSELK